MQCAYWRVLAGSTVTAAPESTVIEEALRLAEIVDRVKAQSVTMLEWELEAPLAPITDHSQVGLHGWLRSVPEHNTPSRDGKVLCSLLISQNTDAARARAASHISWRIEQVSPIATEGLKEHTRAKRCRHLT